MVDVELRPGRTSSFEVTVDGESIHSRLEGQGWPDTEQVLEAIASRLPA
jgi:selT/selW/selH-like putative selenoprotein